MINVIFALLVFSQMLIINIFLMDAGCKRRFSHSTTCMIYFVSIVLYIVSRITTAYFFHIPNNFFERAYSHLFSGIFFLIPCFFIYKDRYTKIISLFFTTWILTATVFFLSSSTSRFFDNEYQIILLYLFQNLLLPLPTVVMTRFIKSKLSTMLQNCKSDTEYMLLFSSVGWFLLIMLINHSFIFRPSTTTVILIILLMCVIISLFFILISRNVRNDKDIERLEKIAYKDNLTGIKNRLNFFLDVQDFILDNVPFSLVYMNLDHVGNINYIYGNKIGDQYIQSFSKCIDSKYFYHMANDEFVYLYFGNNIDSCLKKIQILIDHKFSFPSPFLGVTFSHVNFPIEVSSVDDLLKIADNRMRLAKNEKKNKLFDENVPNS